MFCTFEIPLLGSMIVHYFSHRYTKLIVVSIVYLSNSKIPLCTLIIIPEKYTTMILLEQEKKIHEKLLDSIQNLMIETFTFLDPNQ